MGSLTTNGYPWPFPTEPVQAGAVNIRALAEANDRHVPGGIGWAVGTTLTTDGNAQAFVYLTNGNLQNLAGALIDVLNPFNVRPEIVEAPFPGLPRVLATFYNAVTNAPLQNTVIAGVIVFAWGSVTP